jgi:anti-sigma factor ChrR (cupin superfamily)
VTVKDAGVTDGLELQIVRFNPGASFPVHTHQRPEFIYILEGELIRAGQRLGPGWASISDVGTVDTEVRTEKGCVFLLVDRA